MRCASLDELVELSLRRPGLLDELIPECVEARDIPIVDQVRTSEMAVYPSFFEGFGIPVVEAMYFGCPVVCSYSSGIPEAGGDAAFYFDPTSLPSFEQSLSAALRRLRLERAASRRRASRFAWHDFARRIDKAIARTVAESVAISRS